jgi:hypothetical protein
MGHLHGIMSNNCARLLRRRHAPNARQIERAAAKASRRDAVCVKNLPALTIAV